MKTYLKEMSQVHFSDQIIRESLGCPEDQKEDFLLSLLLFFPAFGIKILPNACLTPSVVSSCVTLLKTRREGTKSA
jgi:hypothetical protein